MAIDEILLDKGDIFARRQTATTTHPHIQVQSTVPSSTSRSRAEGCICGAFPRTEHEIHDTEMTTCQYNTCRNPLITHNQKNNPQSTHENHPPLPNTPIEL